MQIGSRATGRVVSVRITTGGSGYLSPPVVTITGAGGTGVTAYAQVNAGAVQSVFLASAGTGHTGNPVVSFSGGSGSGASAKAFACTTSGPMCFFKGRYGDVYGVDGMGRGIRWDGAATTSEAIGLNRPAVSPTVATGATTAGKVVKSVQIVAGGAGYSGTPVVQFTGGTPSVAAAATAVLQNGRVTAVKVTNQGAGYQATPTVGFSGGMGTGATFSVGVSGYVDGVQITATGAGYGSTVSAPTVSLSTAQGLSGALVIASVDEYGRISDARISAAGSGATTTGVTAVITGAGSGAAASVVMRYRVDAITVGHSGSGYYAAPLLTFRPHPDDTDWLGGEAVATLDGNGHISGVTVVNGGDYSLPPTVLIESSDAIAQAEMAAPLSGAYQCCIRYLDDTPPTQNGPIASSISDLVEVDAGAGAGNLTWTFSHGVLDDRVSAMELWRTTSGQSVILFRVATIQRSDPAFTTAYTDTVTDADLIDTARNGYALMPVTLPSGQVNARRFGVPPGEFAVGCMFQDRAWYAVDATGQRPNALVFSEVDEPEAVPAENELIVQENTGEPDKIVALVPLGGNLLIVQTAHIYKLTYVAQPVIDASIILVSNRGVLNNRCWASLNGVVFLVDSQGMYGFDGSEEMAVSIAIDNLWRNGDIDFSKADKFHVSADAQTKVVRFHYCSPSDTEPTSALCYCVATKSWWAESYPSAVTASCRASVGGRLQVLYGQSGAFLKSSGTQDLGAQPVAYQFRTGALPLQNANGSRSVDLLFTPTASDSALNLALHYNNSATPRNNAITADRGGSFVVTAGGSAQLNLSKTRSALGDATGYARAYFSGRVDDRSVGADRHMAVAISGAQAADPVVIHSLAIDGAG